jgi:hypothetical protein
MVKSRVIYTVITALLLVFITACSASGAATPASTTSDTGGDAGFSEGETAEAPEEARANEPAPAAPSADVDDGTIASGGTEEMDEQGQNTQNVQTTDRKIVYNASMVLEVDEPRRESQALYGLAQRYGGFVSGGNVYEYDEDEEGNPIFRADMQLRVNAEQFVQAQDELRGMANEIVSEQVSTQDVTGEYTDVESRIRNLQRLEGELQILLTEARERSNDMDEVLNIYRELTNVREEIEVLQGRINVLSDLVGLATINVTLVAPELDAPQIQVLDETWDPGVTAREALRAFTEDLQGFADGGIWFLFTGLPRLLVLGVVLLVLYVIGRRIWKWARPYLVSSGPTITPPSA